MLLLHACSNDVVGVQIGLITVQPGIASLLEGEQLQFRAVVEDVSGRALPRAEVTWTSADATVLSIGGDGRGVALRAGAVRVSASFRGVTGTADVTIIAAPAIQLRRDTLVLAATDTIRILGAAGAQSPAAEVIQVRNGGGGTLGELVTAITFGSGQPVGWLTPALAETAAPTTLTLTPQTATLPVGVYHATVSVASPHDDGGPVFLPVSVSLMDFSVTESEGDTRVTEAGSTDTITVVLDARPASDVVFDVATADSVEATAAPEVLTFTPDNWDTPQIVVVTGRNEVIADGDQVTAITVSVNQDASDDPFDPIPDEVVLATTTDDDLADFTLAESDGGTTVDESLTTDDFTVVLDVGPVDDVVLMITVADAGEIETDVDSLVFTPGNWSTAQTVTVTGVDDSVIDGPQLTSVVVSVGSASATAFLGLDDDSVVVTTTDDDGAGLLVVESDGSTVVSESGSVDDFTVALSAQPSSDVVLLVTSGDTEEVTVVGSGVVIFTPGNWNVPVTIDVMGADDDLIDSNDTTVVTIAVDASNSDDEFDLVADALVEVVTLDNDGLAGFRVETGGSTTVGEPNGTDDFTVVLEAAPPSGQVVLDLSIDDPGEADISPTTLTFTTLTWADPQTVTVTAVDDDIIDGSQTSQVTVSIDPTQSHPSFELVPNVIVTVTTTDDDVAGFSVADTASTTVNEALSQDQFTVVLDAEPAEDVVLSITTNDPDEVEVVTATVTFTPDVWDDPQPVIVQGVDDDDDDGDQAASVTVSFDSGDPAFGAVADVIVNVRNVDNDGVGFLLTETSGTSVTEAGSMDTFFVELTSRPASAVVFDITNRDPEEVAVSASTLTFIADEWNVQQTVTVTGEDDFVDDGNQNTPIVFSINLAGTADPDYRGLAPDSVVVTTTDDDGVGFTVTEEGGATVVTEGGSTDEFYVRLDAQPQTGEIVVLRITSEDIGEATVSPAMLTFDPGNWNLDQTVTVTGQDDPVLDGDQVRDITIRVDDPASDPGFALVFDQVVTVTTTDDDMAGFTLANTAGKSVSESGTADEFTAVLDARPVSPVVLTISSDRPEEAIVTPVQLTFAPGAWNVAQTITITGVDDDVIDGSQSFAVRVAVNAGASDPAFGGVPDQAVGVTTTDNDVAGFVIAEVGGTTVNESGSSDEFTVRLSAEPASTVVLTVTSADPSEVAATPPTLTFGPGDWNDPQVVTVTGVPDGEDDGDQVVDVTVAVDVGSSDPAFASVPAQAVSVTNGDIDGVGFTITEIGSTVVNESVFSNDDFQVVLDARPALGTIVVLNISGDDPTEATVSPATLTFTNGNGLSPQVVTVTGVDDFETDGDAESTVTVSVDVGLSDPAFSGVPAQFVTVTTRDNDGTLTGHVFNDLNGDGIQNVGEPNLQFVDVVVTDANTATRTVTTDAGGNWVTPGLPIGAATVDVVEATLPTGSVQTAGDDPTAVTVLAGVSTATTPDGYQRQGALSGHAFEDTNGNGTQDGGEPDLAGVVVDVTGSQGGNYSATSDAGGDWAVTGVPIGPASVDVDETSLPTGAVQTAGDDPTAVTVVAATTTVVSADGFQRRGTLTGHVFLDVNGNGVQDGVEPDLPNVDVDIDDSQLGTTSVTTDANGDWTAAGLPAGAATVDVDDATLPAGSVQTAGDDPTAATVVAGAITPTAADGYQRRGTLTGRVFEDTNGNGVQNGGEAGLVAVDLEITDELGGSHPVTTDAAGDWIATGVPAGDATVDVDEATLPTGSAQTAGDDPTTVTVVGGASTAATPDGYQRRGALSGHVFSDTNGNGVQNGGEPNLSGIVVDVTDSQGAPRTATTNATGDWTVTALPIGDATVDVDETTLPVPSELTAGVDPNTVTVVAATTTSAGIVGYRPQGTLTGHLFQDTNGNGVENVGEPPLVGVQVQVTDALSAVTTVTTDASGDWIAPALAVGSASVDVVDGTLPIGAFQTVGTDPTVVSVVSAATTSAGVDGYQIQGTLTGLIFEDTDGDGIRDGGEPGLAGIDVDVIDSQGATRTATTIAGGGWTLTNVPVGDADVDIVDTDLPAGATRTVGADPTTVTVAAGGSTDAGTVGYQQQGGLSGHVFQDTNGNGVQDGVEPDLAGVDVDVTDSQGGTASVGTDVNGDWIAPGLAIGLATVDVFDPSLPPGSALTVGTDPTLVAVAPATTTDIGAHGYQQQGTVFGHLFDDLDGDGTQDVGEPDLAGVVVDVTDAEGGLHSATTNASGVWTAAGVAIGTADIDVDDTSLPAGAVLTAGVDPSTAVVTAGGSTDAGSVGYQQQGGLSGHIFQDTNGNGVQDGVEPDLSGIDVDVTDSQGATASVGTDANGDWVAPGLAIGSATVDIDDSFLPAGSGLTVGTDPTVFTVVAAVTTDIGDHGYQQQGTVFGHLFDDLDGDGTQDVVEPDLAGVVVDVTDAEGGPHSATTNASGVWTAPGVAIGTANVDVDDTSLPAGAVLTAGFDPTTAVVTAAGSTDAGSVGYQQQGALTGHVFADTDGNGVQDVGEPDLAGIDVDIVDSQSVVRAVQTDSNGDWTMTGLAVGLASVTYDDIPVGYTLTVGGDTTITVVGGTTTTVPETGYRPPPDQD